MAQIPPPPCACGEEPGADRPNPPPPCGEGLGEGVSGPRTEESRHSKDDNVNRLHCAASAGRAGTEPSGGWTNRNQSTPRAPQRRKKAVPTTWVRTAIAVKSAGGEAPKAPSVRTNRNS